MNRDLSRSLPFYLGGFMGPFGTVVILPMFPELREAFGASNEAVSWGITAYMLPMAALLLVSGTLGERFGRVRVLRWSFALYGLASVVTAVAPSLPLFVLGRGLQGACNAFFTPLLLAALTDLTSPDQVGRRVGVYSSFQAAGGAIAPFIGGLAAAVEWRAAFFGTAALSVGLAVALPKTADGESTRSPASLRVILQPRVLLIGLAALFAAAGPYSANLLVGLRARDLLDLSPTAAGLLILAGSSAGLFTAPRWGRLMDRAGARSTSLGVVIATCLAVMTLGVVPGVAGLGVAWFITGGLVVGVVVALQSLAALAVSSNRGGALSATMSFRFVGHAIGPLLWVPVFERSVSAAFLGAGLLGLVAAGALWFVTDQEAAVPREPAPTNPRSNGDIPDMDLGGPS